MERIVIIVPAAEDVLRLPRRILAQLFPFQIFNHQEMITILLFAVTFLLFLIALNSEE